MEDRFQVGVITSTHGIKGEVKVFSESYKAFTTGKSDIDNNQERLFLCKCFS